MTTRTSSPGWTFSLEKARTGAPVCSGGVIPGRPQFGRYWNLESRPAPPSSGASLPPCSVAVKRRRTPNAYVGSPVMGRSYERPSTPSAMPVDLVQVMRTEPPRSSVAASRSAACAGGADAACSSSRPEATITAAEEDARGVPARCRDRDLTVVDEEPVRNGQALVADLVHHVVMSQPTPEDDADGAGTEVRNAPEGLEDPPAKPDETLNPA